MGAFDLHGGHATLDAGERRELLRLFTRGESAFPLSIVIQRTDVDERAVDAANTDTPIIVELKFGSARVGDTVEVDVERGTVITVPWGNVDVIASYERDPQVGAVEPQQRVIASAYIGARNGGTRPTRTRRLGVVAAGSRTAVLVPAYAVDVAVYGIPEAGVYGGGLSLELLRAPGGRPLAAWTITSPAPLRLANGVRAVNVISASNPLVALEFGLCL